jgi:hypothetical protein
LHSIGAPGIDPTAFTVEEKLFGPFVPALFLGCLQRTAAKLCAELSPAPACRQPECADNTGFTPMRGAALRYGTGMAVLALPFRGTWLARNSPARRVPSHGTDLFATTYAIDFVAVRDRRTAATRDWRTLVGTEPVARFFAYGAPVLAPATGRVVAVHDGVPDLVARRSQVSRVPYTLTQGARARAGAAGLAGNHVILQLPEGSFVVLAHLRQHSVRVTAGEPVTTGQALGECGNSGNSMQPHVHIQVMDAADPFTAHGLPMSFRDYRVLPRGGGPPVPVEQGIPNESEVVEPTTGELPT